MTNRQDASSDKTVFTPPCARVKTDSRYSRGGPPFLWTVSRPTRDGLSSSIYMGTTMYLCFRLSKFRYNIPECTGTVLAVYSVSRQVGRYISISRSLIDFINCRPAVPTMSFISTYLRDEVHVVVIQNSSSSSLSLTAKKTLNRYRHLTTTTKRLATSRGSKFREILLPAIATSTYFRFVSVRVHLCG